MVSFFHRSRNLIRVLCFILTASIVGCQSGDLVSALGDDVPPSAEAKISDIARAIQSAPVDQAQLVAAFSSASSASFGGGGGDDGDIPTLTVAEAQELADFYADPEPSLLEIYLEENQGAEKIDLLHAIYTKQDYSDIRATLVSLISAEELVSLDAQVAEVEASMADLALTTDASGKVMINQVALHFMAGAAVTLLVAAVVYKIIPWYRPIAKIVAAAAFGVVAGVLAGAAKELYDSHHPANHTVDWRGDFLRTVGGSALAGVFVVGTGVAVRAVGMKPTTAAIFWIVTGIIIGRPVLRNLLRGYALL